MAKYAYSLHKHGGRIHVTIPAKLAFALGIVDSEGELVVNCVRFDHGIDDEGSYGILKPIRE